MHRAHFSADRHHLSRAAKGLRFAVAAATLAASLTAAAGSPVSSTAASAQDVRANLIGARQQFERSRPPAEMQGQLDALRASFLAGDALERDAFDAARRHIADRKLSARIGQRHAEAMALYQREMEAALQEVDAVSAAGNAVDGRSRIDRLMQRLDGGRPAFALPRGLRDLPGQPRSKAPRGPRRSRQEYAQLFANDRLQLADMGLASTLLAAAAVGIPTAEHLAQTEDAEFTDDIRSLAADLQQQPVAIVNWVRNNIEFVPGYGSVQGAGQTLLNRRGNATDTASLLVALLRASGIPARYVYGTVELEAAAAQNWLGDLRSPQAALALLQQAGVPAEAVLRSGAIGAIRFEHVWVQAYVDFDPSRGARNLAPDTWVPMDASFKELLHTPGIDFSRDLRFDAESFLQRLTAASQRDPQTGAVTGIDAAAIQQQLQAYQQQVGRFIASAYPDARVADVLGTHTLVERHPEVLAAALPYRVVASAEPVLALPDSLRWKLRLQLFSSAADHATGRSTAALERSLPQLDGRRLALSFVPATADDAEVLASYLPQPHADGSPIQPEEFPQEIPGYLVEMSAQLLVGEDSLSSGGSLAMGTQLLFQSELYDPSQGIWESAGAQLVEAGEYHVLGVNGQGMGLPRVTAMAQQLQVLRSQLAAGQYAGITRDRLTGALLEEAGLAYFAVADVNEALFARMAGAVSARQPSLLRAYVDAEASISYGIPTRVRFPGVALQVDRLASAVVTRELDANGQPTGFAAFRRAGLERASAYAHLTLERLYARGAAQGSSAVRALAQAVATGNPIHHLTPQNLQAALERIDLPAADEARLRDGVAGGRSGLTSESPLTIGNWRGSGVVLADDVSGAGDYRISGGDSGRLQSGNMAWLALGSPQQAAGGALPTLDAARSVQQGLEGLLGDVSGIRWSEYAAQPDVIGALMTGFVSAAAGPEAAAQAVLLATANAATGVRGLDATPNHAPQFTSTPVTRGVAGQPYRYPASAADAEGDPIRYSIVRGPGGLVVGASGLVSWDGPVQGEWLVTLRADDGRAWRDQTWSISVEPAPAALTASVTVNPAVADAGAPLTITVSSSGGGGTISRSLTVNGSPVSLPDSGTVQYAAPTDPGSYRIVASVSDGTTTVTREVLVSVRNPDDTTAPSVAITAPAEDAEISGPVDVVGSVGDDNFAYYRLMWRPTGAPDTAWREIVTGSNAVNSGVLGRFDPTTLDNGLYQLGLFVYDVNGRVSSRVVPVEVYGDQKIGQFSVSFLDLDIEASGIPVQVTRTYDTRRKDENLDFGYGWSVDYQSVRLRKNMVLGLQWDVTKPVGQLNLCLRSVGKRRIAITLPDGKVERFTAKNETECSFAQVPPVSIVFEPARGTTSELTIISIPNVEARGGQLFDMDNLEPWNPQQFKLKTEEGLEYYLREGVGIERVKDPWGNTLDFTQSGIVHSNGQSLFFERDTKKRIVAIADPSGKKVRYGYDANGDLVTVTDREGQVTRLSYNRSHGLTEYTDPRGIVVARQIYDEEGRLIATIDANGQRAEVSHQTDTNREVVKNRRGYATTYVYDDTGKVTEVVDALGGVTRYAYDANDNETGITDPLGHTTTRSFNIANKLLSETDALGRVTSTNWVLDPSSKLWYRTTQTDPRGNITRYTGTEASPRSIEEPEGRTTRINYVGKGDIGSLDIAGAVTGYTYNSKGQKTSETDPNGRVTSYELDANGRETARSYARTRADGTVGTIRVTRKLDTEGRVLEETGPTGLKTITVYNRAGKPETQTDARGKLTRFEYDSLARLTRTIHPDGSSEGVAYDVEGNEIEKSDRAGRVTRYEYDALDRLTRTTYPDGSTEEKVHDAAGRVIQIRDAAGHGTANVYDAAGRLTAVTDAQGRTTAYGYDANGNRVSVTDPAGQVTRFEYDALNRLTRTTLPDGSQTQVAWTVQGQKASETDASGRTTAFGYDAKGQLTSVTQNDGSQDLVTRYGYDELGNKTSQQDAEGRITRWEYNDLSQVTARILPEGQKETFGYDANGNLVRHTDFKGKATTYAYDDVNREIEKRHVDGSVVKTTYAGSGQIETLVDARGTTRHHYDARDRLIRVESPEGVIRYQYDEAGNRSLISTNHQSVQYQHDELNRLVAVTDAKGKQTTYAYDAQGRKTRTSLPNGTTTEYDYDANGRLIEIRHEKTADQTLLGAFRYALAANGQRTKLEERNQQGPTRTADYQYDGLGRLTREAVTDHRDASKGYSIDFVHDKVGNRLSQTRTKNGKTEVTTYSYDRNDRLLGESRTVDGGPASTTAYTYDANGNTTGKTVTANGQNTAHGYSWNGDDRLTGYTVNGQQQASYQYEPGGIRTRKTTPDDTTHYLVDHNQAYAQVIEENDSPSGDPEVVYLHGDDLLQQVRAGQGTYYHADGLGSTRLLTSTDGTATDRYDYEAYGELAEHVGSSENDFLFTGEQYDGDLGLTYLRARYLNVGAGRLLSQDTYLGACRTPATLHKFMYAHADPANNVDPSGNMTMSGLGSVMSSIGSSIRMASFHFGRGAVRAGWQAAKRSGEVAQNWVERIVKNCLKPKKIDKNVPIHAGTKRQVDLIATLEAALLNIEAKNKLPTVGSAATRRLRKQLLEHQAAGKKVVVVGGDKVSNERLEALIKYMENGGLKHGADFELINGLIHFGVWLGEVYGEECFEL
ncbi:MAG TPA: transglutaminase domain-containing protein [Solimonas sp.]|nr:transglutaminase domain-containing protein [Solimonas sp.]